MQDKEIEELLFLPLGGCNEIGMNLNAYAYGNPPNRKWILVDIRLPIDSLNNFDQ